MKRVGAVDSNTKFGFIAGMAGGVYQWMLNINLHTGFFSKLMEGAITAVVCGFVGMAGKELYTITMKAIKEYFKKHKTKTDEQIS